jgi:hypothetical protein
MAVLLWKSLNDSNPWANPSGKLQAGFPFLQQGAEGFEPRFKFARRRISDGLRKSGV